MSLSPSVKHFARFLAILAAAGLAGCSSVEYKVRESLGQQKRELLVDRVESAKDSQEAAKEQFIAALEQFKAITGFDGGSLEDKYDDVNAQYKRCATRARDVGDRIDAVNDVANALFREWERELREYSSETFRVESERKLRETIRAYERLIEVMRNAEARMKPVLATLKDQVLHLKHNLNARAIASLGGMSVQLENDVSALVADMQKAIDDATAFIEEMKSGGAQ